MPLRVDALTSSLVALALGLLVALHRTPRLPMVDLPQHAAQLAIWLHLENANFADAPRFFLNLRTPYLGAYVLARALASWLPVVAALKWVVWLSIVGHALAFAVLVEKLGHARWLALLGLPLATGYGFYFGFISFNAALPFAIGSLCAALAQRENPSLRSGLALAMLLCLTLFTHGFACGMALVCAAPLLARSAPGSAARAERRSFRAVAMAAIKRLLPLAAPCALAVLWLAPGSSAQSIGYTIWAPRLWDLAQIPALLLASSGADRAASLLGVMMLAATALTLGRPAREPERWLPVLTMLLGFCLFPLSLSGFSPLHPRFAALFVPTLLLAFQPRTRPLRLPLPALLGALSAAWLGLFLWRLQAFTRETQPLGDFVAQAPPSMRMRPIVFEADSRVYPALPALMHLPAYYAAEKGGRQGYSFAMYPTSVIRYASWVTPTMAGGAEWHPETFSADAELDAYDCFLVHGERDRSAELFGKRLSELELAFHEGAWRAYLTRASVAARRAGNQEATGHGSTLAVRDFQ